MVVPLDGWRRPRTAMPWPMLAEGRVAVAGGDHGQQYGLPAPVDARAQATLLLGGRQVRGVSLAEGSSELEIRWEGGVALRTFNDSSGYEGWDLCGPGGGRWVCQGGGAVCRIVIDDESHSHGEPGDGWAVPWRTPRHSPRSGFTELTPDDSRTVEEPKRGLVRRPSVLRLRELALAPGPDQPPKT